MTPDNKVGFALKPNGDIVSAFSRSKADRAGDSILALAVQQGGKQLDAFDTVLPALYSRSGFRAVARLAWDDKEAPPGWDKKTFAKYNGGRPDVVFMVHDPAYGKPYKAGDGPVAASYDDALAMQDAALKEIASRHKSYRYVTLLQARELLSPASYRKYHDVLRAAGPIDTNTLRIALAFDPSEPRDEEGKWTDGGGSDGGGHPGEGYSANAYVDAKGVIHTSNVYDAQRALFENRKVELKQVKQISTLIQRLGAIAKEMAAAGEAAPVFNLCNVTVEGTNLFCAESKGIPRVEMPVIPAKQTKDFIKHLKKLGYKVEKENEYAANLRATQDELSGAKVAAAVDKIKEKGEVYKRIIVSRDDYILDGHHTWAGQLAIDAADNDLHDDKSVPVARVDISIIKLIEEAEKWTGGAGKKPASEAASLLSRVRKTTAPLYVHRDLQNVEAFTAWAQAQGFVDIVDDPHVTVLYSKEEVDWDDVGDTDTGTLVVPAGGKRTIEELGDEGAIVLRFASAALSQRHDEFVDDGASHDYDDYLPHVTITLSGVIPAGAEPYDGELIFGPEIFETITKAFDPSEPRDEEGKWTSGGASNGGGTSPSPTDKPEEPQLDPKVIEVGGDEWNRATARRLEREYQEARPKVDKLAQDSVKAEPIEVEASDDEDEEEGEPPFEPEEWDMLSSSGQTQAEEEYKSKNKDAYYENEVTNWQESGGATDDGASQVEYEFNKSGEAQWAEEAIKDVIEENDEVKFPYTPLQLLNAITLSYETGYEGNMDKSLTIEFDDSKLQEPNDIAKPDPAQLELPGTPPPEDIDYSKHLTDDMRELLLDELKSAFEKETEKKADSIEPPDYLMESAEEFLGEMWEQMEDKEKFDFVKNSTSIVENETTEGTGSYAPKPSGKPKEPIVVAGLPNKYDPLNDTSGLDYQRTQTLAHYLSIERTVQVLKERSIDSSASTGEIASIDNRLWRAWKDSSTSANGKLLQVAVADELGGRLNTKTAVDIDREEMKEHANQAYSSIGGYAGVKAYVRAKWEVTQYLLDKAGVKELQLYRGINFNRADDLKGKYDKKYDVVVSRHYEARQKIGEHIFLPTLDVARNGAASTTTDPAVANHWSSDDRRVVLRAVMPRTAAISVPAYGVNIQSEHEVVIAGTAWKGWDAWAGKAPPLEQVPLKLAA